MEVPSKEPPLLRPSINQEQLPLLKEPLIKLVRPVPPIRPQDHHNFIKVEATKDQPINLDHQEFTNQAQETSEHQELEHHQHTSQQLPISQELTTTRAAHTAADQVEVE